MLQRTYLAAIVLMVAALATACSDGNRDTPSLTSAQGQVTTTTSPSGNATITKTFQTGVVLLPTDAATAIDESTLNVSGASAPLSAGSVFTWNNRAFVATTVNTASDGTLQVSTRLAEFQEVLADLEVTGDLTSQDFDFGRMTAAAEDGTLIKAPSSTNSDRLLAPKANSVIAGPCRASVGNIVAGEPTTATCEFIKPYQSFSFSFKVGFRDAIFRGLTVKASPARIDLTEMLITPFARVDLTFLGTNNQPVPLAKDDIPILYVQVPVESTLGFLRLDIPVRLDLSLPLFQFKMGAEVAFPYSSLNGWSFQPSLDTPVATLGGAQLFKYELSDAHVYDVAGAELVLAKSLAPKPSVQWFSANSPDRLASVGALVKGGWQGDLSVEVPSLNAKPCFRWNLQPTGGVASDIRLGTDRIDAISKTKMVPFGQPISGSSGCSESPACKDEVIQEISARTGESTFGRYKVHLCSPDVTVGQAIALSDLIRFEPESDAPPYAWGILQNMNPSWTVNAKLSQSYGYVFDAWGAGGGTACPAAPPEMQAASEITLTPSSTGLQVPLTVHVTTWNEHTVNGQPACTQDGSKDFPLSAIRVQ